jgi:site-specific recombinase XerD
MAYQLHREVRQGQLCRLWLGLELVDEYLDFLRCRCRPNTWISYAHDLKVFFSIVDKPVSEVTTADVFRFMELQTHPYTRDTCSAQPEKVCIRTLKRRLCAVSGLYNYLLMGDTPPVKRNPVPSGLVLRGQIPGTMPRLNPLLRVPNQLPQLVPVEQIQRFLASLNTYRDKAMLLLMVLAGLRKSEVLGMEVNDLNPAKGTVRVRQGKGGRERVCCVTALFFQVLEHYLDEERPSTAEPRLFLALKGPRRGQPLSVSGLNTIIAHHRRLAKTPELNCHRLRHTCLTLLREAGMSLEALQQQAGHQNINTTRLYLHLSNQELREEYFRVSEQLFTTPLKESRDA